MTAFWIGLNYWVPGLQASSVPSTTVRLAIHIAVVLGLWLALERTELAPRRRLGVWLTVVVPYTLWLSIIWSAAINGVFRPGNNIPPLVPLAIFLPVIVGVPILLGSKQIGELLGAMSTSWLINMELRRGRSTEMADRTASRIGGALLLVLAAYIGACGHRRGRVLLAGSAGQPRGDPDHVDFCRPGNCGSPRHSESRALRARAVESITCGWLSLSC